MARTNFDLWFTFLASAFWATFFAEWHLLFFAPFLLLILYQKPLSTTLWAGALVGLWMDLHSAQMHLGLHAISYVVTLYLLSRQKGHFYPEALTTIPTLSLLFGISSTAILAVLYLFFEKPLPFTKNWFITDILVMPLFDGLYALLLVSLPLYLWKQYRRPAPLKDER